MPAIHFEMLHFSWFFFFQLMIFPYCDFSFLTPMGHFEMCQPSVIPSISFCFVYLSFYSIVVRKPRSDDSYSFTHFEISLWLMIWSALRAALWELKRIQIWAGDMVGSLKCSLYEHEDLGLDHQHSHKKPDIWVWWHVSITPVLRGGMGQRQTGPQRRLPRKISSSTEHWAQERSCLRKNHVESDRGRCPTLTDDLHTFVHTPPHMHPTPNTQTHETQGFHTLLLYS